MIDYRQAIERAVDGALPRPDGYERLLHRLRRKHRRQRVTAAVVAMGIAAAGFGVLLEAFNDDDARPYPPGTAITPENVQDLGLAWTGQFGPESRSLDGDYYSDARGPTVGDGYVFVASDFKLSAFPVGCGSSASSCSPAWTAPVEFSFGPWDRPIVAGNSVFVASRRNDDGIVYSFPTACRSDGGICAPNWTATFPHRPVTDLVADNRSVFAATNWSGGPGPDSSLLYAMSQDCPQACHPEWSARIDVEMSRLALSGHELMAASLNGLVAFSTNRCKEIHRAGGMAPCKPLWQSARSDNPQPQTLIATTGMVFIDGVDEVRAYAATGCGAEVCGPLWTAPLSRFPGKLAVDGETLFASAGFSFDLKAPPASLIESIPLNCREPCEPISAATIKSRARFMSQSNGVIFTSEWGVHAYSTDCLKRSASCAPIWIGAESGWTSPVEVSDGVAYVASPYTGLLYAFDLDKNSVRSEAVNIYEKPTLVALIWKQVPSALVVIWLVGLTLFYVAVQRPAESTRHGLALVTGGAAAIALAPAFPVQQVGTDMFGLCNIFGADGNNLLYSDCPPADAWRLAAGLIVPLFAITTLLFFAWKPNKLTRRVTLVVGLSFAVGGSAILMDLMVELVQPASYTKALSIGVFLLIGGGLLMLVGGVLALLRARTARASVESEIPVP